MLTTAEVKQHLRITDTDSDTHVAALITRATKAIENYTRRVITLREDQTLVLDGFPAVIVLPLVPVIEVTSIAYNDGNDAAQTLASSAYRVDTRKLRNEITPVYNTVWPTTSMAPESVTVTYSAGYADSDAVPEDMKHGGLIVIASMYSNAGDNDEAPVIPAAAKFFLDHYRVPMDITE